jgi:hypothetical protein
MSTSLVCFSRIITRSRPYRRLQTQIQPSISLRSPDSCSYSSRAYRYTCLSLGGRPSLGPFSQMPRSLHQAKFSRVLYILSANPPLWVLSCPLLVPLHGFYQRFAFVERVPGYLFNPCVTFAQAQRPLWPQTPPGAAAFPRESAAPTAGAGSRSSHPHGEYCFHTSPAVVCTVRG